VHVGGTHPKKRKKNKSCDVLSNSFLILFEID
jgi:hypothetical protein